MGTEYRAPTICLSLTVAIGCAQGKDLNAAQACIRLSDDAARLSCYDAALDFARSAAGAGMPQNAQTTDASRTKEQTSFGEDARPHAESKSRLPKTLAAQVQMVSGLAGGLFRLTLDNGQVWDTTQADSALVFEASDAVRISRGLLGSYQISLAGHTTSVGVTRKK